MVPTTVATNSWSIKQIIKKALEETSDNTDSLDFKLHDFGARGVSSSESASIGGLAHLVNFKGTDTVESLVYAKRYYNEPMAGFSVPAAEHSSITSWGKEGELDAYRNMLEQFKGSAIIAVVSDSYDIFNADENMWGGELKDEVIQSGSTLVVRPDSGDPASVVCKVALLLDSKFGSTINAKGYKVLNNVRILQGDGITEKSIIGILSALRGYNFSAENVVFGLGGGLLQKVDRDTNQFAMKASAAKVDGNWVDVFKDPITDKGKSSKKGIIQLYRQDVTDKYITGTVDMLNREPSAIPMFENVYLNGELKKEYSLEDIRSRAATS